MGFGIKGMVFGIYPVVLDITLLSASLIAGILNNKTNAVIPFYFSLAMAVLAILLVLIFIGAPEKVV
ncbi:MAG: hypothetical protein RR356_07160 [Bacteroidales bacterium]